jgi:hypothetical protein
MSHRDVFNSMAYLELLDKTSNGTSGPLIQNNIAAERQKQEAFDPSLIGQTLKFEQVELDGGTEAERWNSDQIRMGEHLDAYEKVIKK